MSRVEILRASDGFDEPLRCENCRAQFACQPKKWGERGPTCQECVRRIAAMGRAGYLNRETFGDRRLDVIVEDV